jgi:hypothetical protein
MNYKPRGCGVVSPSLGVGRGEAPPRLQERGPGGEDNVIMNYEL